jgi:hypothetical protein
MKKKKTSKIGFNATPIPQYEAEDSTLDAFTEEEVKVILRWVSIPDKEFFDWHGGQTGIILPNGKLGYYKSDLEFFVQHKLAGYRSIPIFD